MMRKNKLDYSVKELAEQGKNKAAMVGVFIMNIVLAAAYLLEVIKGARTVTSYGIIVLFCTIPCVLALILYKRKKDSGLIRYVCGIGFMFLYGYVMWTTTTDLVFCYIIVFFVIFVVYVDVKLLVLLSIYALFINIIVIARKAMNGTLTQDGITNAEIIIACLVLTCLFTLLALQKIEQINKANIEKADSQRIQADGLLNTTLQVASSMTENIAQAVTETDSLKSTIGMTQHAMAKLVADTNEEVEAIEAQKQSTHKINDYISGVETAVHSIIGEVNIAEENLNAGNQIMNDLLEQVHSSEEANVLVVQKMQGLKECAGKMQDIMELIRDVADQTRLLSLNASIEAARAGEAGRGFAVVASEISALSTQTNSATGDIDKLIENIVHSVGEVTNAMDQLLEGSQLQNRYVNQTADSFSKIHNSTQGIFAQVSHLKDTVEIVTEENQQVAEQIENVSVIMGNVMNGAKNTYENCNVNLESIANMAIVMDNLKDDATKLQQ